MKVVTGSSGRHYNSAYDVDIYNDHNEEEE